MGVTQYGELRDKLLRQSLPNVYAPVVLRDADSGYIPLPISERLVQCIWYDQRLAPTPLRTTDGQPVEVIFPGWWNLEAGPDFRHAAVKLGDGPELQGDVEVHLRAEDWEQHGHHRDPLYDNVILHVVLWDAGSQRVLRNRQGDLIPQLALQSQLAAPLEQLYDEIDMDAYPFYVRNHGGRCAATIAQLPAAGLGRLLESAGDERFAAKVRRFARWLHRVGPEQAFYEGWMEALGYKANKTTFRALAQRVPLDSLAQHGKADYAALLFGQAGFLPTLSTKAADPYVRQLWNRWWKLRSQLEPEPPPLQWRLNAIRPANHPHRRLGAAVALLKRHTSLAEKAVAAIETDGDPAKLFLAIADEYWSRHFTLGGKPQAQETELLGPARVGEIIANILLPFVAAQAGTQNNSSLSAKAKARYDALRPSADNALVRLAGQQLFDDAHAARRLAKTGRQQQGLIQIFQDFCLNDKGGCRQCQFPALVQQWTA